MNWTKAHSGIVLALLGVVCLHMKIEPSWAHFFTIQSMGTLGGEIITTLIAMFVGSPLIPKWDGVERRAPEPVGGATIPFPHSANRS